MKEETQKTQDIKAELDYVKSKLAGLEDLAKVIGNPRVKKVIEEELNP